ncbi:hypothetical protein AB4Z34_10375 [Ensifer sp. 2YAB10]|uniref:hypothetical protein n=1 Tax=unclassified Ensifer TaxID=2633371 RepID=UPI003F8F0158
MYCRPKSLLFLAAMASVSLTHTLPATANGTSGYSFVQGYPTAETSAKAYDDADLQRAITAYRFWYPTVSVEGIFNGNRSVGINDNEAMGAAAGPARWASR